MKKKILTIIYILGLMTFCNAQRIEIKKVPGGYRYIQNGNKLNMRGLVKKMRYNQQAYDLIRKAKSNKTLPAIMGFIGGYLIGRQIGKDIVGGDANWALAGVGIGLIAIEIPIYSSVNKKIKQAIQLYNSSLESTSFYEFKPEFKIVANHCKIGFVVNF